MMIMFNYFFKTLLVTIGILAYMSCVKNHMYEGNTDYPCEDLPDYPMGVRGIQQAHYQSQAPAFNPTNSDEFVFTDVHGDNSDLVIYTISTKHKSIIVKDANVRGQPRWGDNGLIVYTDPSFSLVVVETLGNLKSKISSSGSFLYPYWLSDSLIVAQFSYNLGVPYYRVLVNLKGQIIDSAKGPGFHRGVSISPDEFVSVNYENKATLIESNSSGHVNRLFDLSFDGSNIITGLAYNQISQVFYFSTFREGVYIFNPQEGTRLKLLPGCETKCYDYMSISGDSKFLLLERVDAYDYKNDTGIYSVKSGIFLYDISKGTLTALDL
ncbi:MAG TPA: hypothetical protein DIW47_11540 [Bacteroidetes bacterium]|nr:hypothetical protein [Bacteroidota bacterium]